MNVIGLDIGTTTLSAVLMAGDEPEPRMTLTREHHAFLPGKPWERIQDAEKIASLALGMVGEMSAQGLPVHAVGLTGQMHGVLYVNAQGRAVSPLYTWQDGRGNLPASDGRRFCEALSAETGCTLASGYGSVTHAHLLRGGELPESATKMCTISAYVGMRLTGRASPLLHDSDAASMGCWDLARARFSESAVSSLAPEYFPESNPRIRPLGQTGGGAVVFSGVGDNQASFFAAARGRSDAVLLNIGTGSQVSMQTDRPVECPGCETRPLYNNDFLLVGAPLCGGRAYAILERFIRECVALSGAQPESLYDKMNALAMEPPQNPPVVCTAFSGTRADPGARGSIVNLSENNFTPAGLIYGTLAGMAGELHAFYRDMERACGQSAARLIGSGNAVRRNPALRQILSGLFGMPLEMPACAEEAASGAAYLAMREMKQLI